jgi:hypothetical protein
MANAATIEIAREVRQNLAGSALTERQAKLYSQRLRRDMGREGLASFLPKASVDASISHPQRCKKTLLVPRDPATRRGLRSRCRTTRVGSRRRVMG